jgi:hypothetical protein
MANKTINGCLSLSTKQVVFQGEACNSGNYTGCYVSSGVHEGQIAVTFTEANCPADTYYACFNPGTGQFQLIIPDNCCVIYGTPCSYCQTPAETPSVVSCTFNGITTCNCIDVESGSYQYIFNFNINDTFLVPQISVCNWYKLLGTVSIRIWYQNGCTGGTGGMSSHNVFCALSKISNQTVGMNVTLGNSPMAIFLTPNFTPSSRCVEATVNNSIVACVLDSRIAYGGSATIIEP